MKKTISVAGMAAALLIPFAVWTQAQPPGVSGAKSPGAGHGMSGPGGGFGGMRGPGGPGGFRRSEKMRLGGLLRGIGELEKQKKTPLSKDQAKKIVATVAPWQKKPKMSETEAKALYAKISGFLTTPQKAALAKTTHPGGMRGPGGLGGSPGGHERRGGGPGGHDGMRGPGDRQGRPGGFGGGPPDEKRMQEMRQRMEKMRGFMATFNPLYPIGSYKEFKDIPERAQERFKERSKDQQALLSQLARKAK